jgi:hypothetical protein
VSAHKVSRGAERRGLQSPGLQLFAPYHMFGSMPSHSRNKPEPTTTEDASRRNEDPEQRRDALLLRLLKMPPQSRAETAERARRAKKKPTRIRANRGGAKREPSA